MQSRPTVSCGRCSAQFDAEYSVEPKLPDPPVVLVEKTSKRYKRQQVVGVLFMLASFGGCAAGSATDSGGLITSSVFLFLFASVWLLIVRITIWWNHG